MDIAISTLLERLAQEGVISGPRSARRPIARDADRVRARGSVTDLLSEQRDAP